MERHARPPLVRLLDRLSPWRSAFSRLGDALALLAALAAAHAAYGLVEARRGNGPPAELLGANPAWLALWFGLALLALHLASTYASTRTTTWLTDLHGIVSALSVAAILTLTLSFLAGERSIPRLVFVLTGTTGAGALAAWRLLARQALAVLRRRGVAPGRLLLIGAGPAAQRLVDSVARRPALGYQVAGYLDDGQRLTGCRWLGPLAAMTRAIDRQRADEVILAGAVLSHPHIMTLVERCRRQGVPLKLLPDTFELALTRVALEQLDGHPLLCLTQAGAPPRDLAKRLMDIVIAGAVLLVLAPLLLVIAALIARESPGPIIFRQTRVGRHGRHFTLYKFRSMVDGAEAQLAALRRYNEASGPLFKLRHDPRVTRVGRWLRTTSLDELPQVVNVLKGDMSLVGPRPGVPDEVAQYVPWQRARLEGMPGITGLWQVSGRSLLSFDEMVRLDLDYIRRRSLLLDLVILLRTVPVILTGRGAF